MLQSTDTDKIANMKGSWRNARIYLGRSYRRDFVSGLRVEGDGNMSYQGEGN